MIHELEIPFPPPHHPTPGGRVEPPWVAVVARWEYRDVVRDASSLPSEQELNALGDQGWELIGVAPVVERVHYYFKRERPA